jgi:hypothetical protein
MYKISVQQVVTLMLTHLKLSVQYSKKIVEENPAVTTFAVHAMHLLVCSSPHPPIRLSMAYLSGPYRKWER